MQSLKKNYLNKEEKRWKIMFHMKQTVKILLKNNEKETQARKEYGEDKISNEEIRDKNAKVRECRDENFSEQCNNKDKISEKQLIESK